MLQSGLEKAAPKCGCSYVCGRPSRCERVMDASPELCSNKIRWLMLRYGVCDDPQARRVPRPPVHHTYARPAGSLSASCMGAVAFGRSPEAGGREGSGQWMRRSGWTRSAGGRGDARVAPFPRATWAPARSWAQRIRIGLMGPCVTAPVCMHACRR